MRGPFQAALPGPEQWAENNREQWARFPDPKPALSQFHGACLRFLEPLVITWIIDYSIKLIDYSKLID